MTKALTNLNNHVSKAMEVKQVIINNNLDYILIEDQDLKIDLPFMKNLLLECDNLKNDLNFYCQIEQTGVIDKFNNIFDMVILSYKVNKEVAKIRNSNIEDFAADLKVENIVNTLTSGLTKLQEKIYDEIEFH